MILIGISVSAVVLAAAIVALVILISVLAGANAHGAAIIADMVLIGILVGTNIFLAAALIADMILVVIHMITQVEQSHSQAGVNNRQVGIDAVALVTCAEVLVGIHNRQLVDAALGIIPAAHLAVGGEAAHLVHHLGEQIQHRVGNAHTQLIRRLRQVLAAQCIQQISNGNLVDGILQCFLIVEINTLIDHTGHLQSLDKESIIVLIVALRQVDRGVALNRACSRQGLVSKRKRIQSDVNVSLHHEVQVIQQLDDLGDIVAFHLQGQSKGLFLGAVTANADGQIIFRHLVVNRYLPGSSLQLVGSKSIAILQRILHSVEVQHLIQHLVNKGVQADHIEAAQNFIDQILHLVLAAQQGDQVVKVDGVQLVVVCVQGGSGVEVQRQIHSQIHSHILGKGDIVVHIRQIVLDIGVEDNGQVAVGILIDGVQGVVNTAVSVLHKAVCHRDVSGGSAQQAGKEGGGSLMNTTQEHHILVRIADHLTAAHGGVNDIQGAVVGSDVAGNGLAVQVQNGGGAVEHQVGVHVSQQEHHALLLDAVQSFSGVGGKAHAVSQLLDGAAGANGLDGLDIHKHRLILRLGVGQISIGTDGNVRAVVLVLLDHAQVSLILAHVSAFQSLIQQSLDVGRHRQIHIGIFILGVNDHMIALQSALDVLIILFIAGQILVDAQLLQGVGQARGSGIGSHDHLHIVPQELEGDLGVDFVKVFFLGAGDQSGSQICLIDCTGQVQLDIQRTVLGPKGHETCSALQSRTHLSRQGVYIQGKAFLVQNQIVGSITNGNDGVQQVAAAGLAQCDQLVAGKGLVVEQRIDEHLHADLQRVFSVHVQQGLTADFNIAVTGECQRLGKVHNAGHISDIDDSFQRSFTGLGISDNFAVGILQHPIIDGAVLQLFSRQIDLLAGDGVAAVSEQRGQLSRIKGIGIAGDTGHAVHGVLVTETGIGMLRQVNG